MFDLTSQDTGHFIYLILLLVMLSSGILFNSKIRKIEILKQLFLWSIITLILIIIYSFRFEFQNIVNRLKGELFPSSAINLGENKISINISSNQHFYVDLKINGQNVHFMIDTGASDIVLSEKDAKKVGIDLAKLSYDKIYETANGNTFGASSRVKTIELQGLVIYNAAVSVNNSDLETSLLGMSFLRNFKKYEFYQDKLVLTY